MLTVIRSRENQNVKWLSRLVSSPKFRKKENSFVVEGVRLCNEAVFNKVSIKALFVGETFYNDNSSKIEQLINNAPKIFLLSDSVLNFVSDTETPQGVICVCEMENSVLSIEKGNYIALENLQDPANVGTIFRTAAAFGIDGIILSSGCCDIYSPKVLRGTMGAVFKQPFMIVDDFAGFVAECNAKKIKTLACALKEDSKSLTQISLSYENGMIALIGNEGKGLSEDVINLCNESIIIPMKAGVESLNASVAASIIMWEMSKARGWFNGSKTKQ